MVYLDNNATTAVLPEVREAMDEVLVTSYGNPSSAHALGRLARGHLVRAREAIAKIIKAPEPESVIFTSGGTESNNLVLSSCLSDDACRKRLLTTNVEHSSILHAAEDVPGRLGIQVVELPVDADGLISLERLVDELKGGAGLVSVQWVNNETGVVQDIGAIAQACAEAGVRFHTDAAQALGKLTIDVNLSGVDFLTLSAHKIHGPKGVGAVYSRERGLLRPLLHGGPHEAHLRAGTENCSGIVGFGHAAEIRLRDLAAAVKQMQELRDRFERYVTGISPRIFVNGAGAPRACNTANICFAGIEGAALVANLDARDVACSQNSACTSQLPEASYVLRAMGLSEDDAFSSVRFCFSVLNSDGDVDQAVGAIREVYALLSQ